ncbi:hypothetical protein TNCV_3124091 [Trichonephila clavipes]|nr:hypothetical protein TNCV_3124091 [Trichonephila clavipes]
MFFSALRETQRDQLGSDLKVQRILLEAQWFSKYHFSAGCIEVLLDARSQTQQDPWQRLSIFVSLEGCREDETELASLVCGYDGRYTEVRYPVSDEAFTTASAEISLTGITSGHRVKRSMHVNRKMKSSDSGNGPTRSIWTC